ncbi:RING-type E3 ubiquitin transferase [Ranunculus cassubicifolius]
MADSPIDTVPSSPSLEEMSGKVMVAAIIVLFMVILFVLFLHLYARWFWSRRGSEIHGHHRRRFVFAPQDPAVALHRGLEPSVIRSLPVVVFKTEEFKEGLECAVCLCDLEDGEKARLLPTCKHGFHLECIDMWFQSHSTCPLCRNTVGVESNASSSPELQSVSEGESMNFPTNVLFWGNDSLVSARSNEGPPSSSSSSAYSSPNESRDGSLVIDIPSRIPDSFMNSISPSASRFGEEEMKSPMTPMSARLRSLRRLLSREKRVIPSSPSSIDIEQGEGVRGQSSKTISES